MPISIGLTLGKFAPLHKGHQAIIEKAIKEMDAVVVMIYDSPEITNIPLTVRANWIRTLYKNYSIRVIECTDHPKEDGYSEEIKKAHEEYIGKKLREAGIHKKISHFYSNEPYGEHVSKYLGAVDVRWGDKNICATMIRENPYQNRFFVHPLVYRDTIKKCCFMGAESTGKSTIVRALAEEYRTSYVHEYGADFWKLNQVNMRLTLKQLEQIAKTHVEIEKQYSKDANRVFFADTCPITTRMFSLFYHNDSTSGLDTLARLAEKEYDHFFLCDVDIPYENTWDRSGAEHRIEFQKSIIRDLYQRGISFTLLSGDLQTRIKTVKSIIGGFKS